VKDEIARPDTTAPPEIGGAVAVWCCERAQARP
jgi:hypothetical protein